MPDNRAKSEAMKTTGMATRNHLNYGMPVILPNRPHGTIVYLPPPEPIEETMRRMPRMKPVFSKQAFDRGELCQIGSVPMTFREQLCAALEDHVKAGGLHPVVCTVGRLSFVGLASEMKEHFRCSGSLQGHNNMLNFQPVEIDGVMIHASFTREDGFEVA